LHHIYWVLPRKLCGRPGPSEAPWSVPDLRAAGIQSVLTLCEKQDVAALTAASFSHARFSLPANVPPQAKDDDLCRAVIPGAVAFLEAEIGSGRCTLVHCAAGRDRTAMALASYLAATMGIEATQAISAVRRARPDALAADGWEAMARRVISSLWP